MQSLCTARSKGKRRATADAVLLLYRDEMEETFRWASCHPEQLSSYISSRRRKQPCPRAVCCFPTTG